MALENISLDSRYYEDANYDAHFKLLLQAMNNGMFGDGTGSTTPGEVSWDAITNKPTTIEGYGITDAVSANDPSQTVTASSFVGDLTGNADTSSKIKTAVNISLSGVTTTAQPFDGSADVTIPVTEVPASLITGVLGINNIPAAAVNTIVTVANDSERFGLTTDKVQNGDMVLVTETGKLYLVIDDTQLTSEAGYREYSAGIAAQALADGDGNIITETYATKQNVNSELSNKADVVHTHVVSDITDFPSDLVKTSDLDNYTTKTTFDELNNVAVKYSLYDNRKFVQLANHDAISGVMTNGDGANLVMLSKWDKADFGSPKVTMNLNTIDNVTVNDSDIVITESKLNSVLTDYAKTTELPTQLPNPNALTIKYNGKQAFRYDGSAAETGNFTVTLGTIPVAVTDSGDLTTSDAFPANSLLRIDNSGTVIAKATAGVDYVMPSGNVATASKLSNTCSIGLSGVTATAQPFDGSADITIPISAVPYSIVTGTPTKLSEFENDLVMPTIYADSIPLTNSDATLVTAKLDELTDSIEDIASRTPVMCTMPIRTLKNQVYEKSEILGWFGVEDDAALKKIISGNKPIFLKYGIILSYKPMHYKMPIQYIAYETDTQIKMIITGLNTQNDVVTKYEVIMNLDGTIIDGNCNIKITPKNMEKVYEVGETAPENTDLLWLDTVNGKIKYYNGTDWTEFTITQ